MLDSQNFVVKRKNAFTLLDVEDTWLLEVWEVGPEWSWLCCQLEINWKRGGRFGRRLHGDRAQPKSLIRPPWAPVVLHQIAPVWICAHGRRAEKWWTKKWRFKQKAAKGEDRKMIMLCHMESTIWRINTLSSVPNTKHRLQCSWEREIPWAAVAQADAEVIHTKIMTQKARSWLPKPQCLHFCSSVSV